MRRAGAPFCHSISNAPLASILAKALIVRSSVLILPLPRIPIHRQPATRTRQAATTEMVIFFIRNMPSVIVMRQKAHLDSRKTMTYGGTGSVPSDEIGGTTPRSSLHKSRFDDERVSMRSGFVQALARNNRFTSQFLASPSLPRRHPRRIRRDNRPEPSRHRAATE